MFTKDIVTSYADKLLIGLTEEETTNILEEFEVIDQTINEINNIEGLNSINPAFMPYDAYEATLRDDNEIVVNDTFELLRNCQDVDGREVKVPKVVGNENN